MKNRRLSRTRASVFTIAMLVLSVPVLAQSSAPTSTPSTPTLDSGRLVIRAVQKTEGATTPAGAKAQVHLFANGEQFGTLEALLDDQATATLEGIPLKEGIRPLISVEFAGVTYQQAGPLMNRANPNASVDVQVFGVTEQAPSWRVASRQIMLTPDEGKLIVSESVIIDNPANRTWLGGNIASNGKQTTIELGLPAGAQDIILVAGFHDWCCTTFENAILAVQMPLMPGKKQHRFSYTLAMDEGRVDLPFAAIAPTDELSIFVPDKAFQITPQKMRTLSAQETEQGVLRMYHATDVPAVTPVGLRITGMLDDPTSASTTATTGAAMPPTATSTLLMTLIAVIVILAVAGVIVWWSRKTGAPAPPGLDP